MARSKTTETTLPHSWDLEHWPASVYPHSGVRAKYLIRTFRDDLILEGAMSRVGRELVFLGARYNRWLEKRTAQVPGYDNVPHRVPRSAQREGA